MNKKSSITIRCSGPDPKSEHPMVYLIVSSKGWCPYCHTEYQLSSEEIAKRSLDSATHLPLVY